MQPDQLSVQNFLVMKHPEAESEVEVEDETTIEPEET